MALQVYYGNTLDVSITLVVIGTSSPVKQWRCVSEYLSQLFPKYFGRFVSNPNKVILELCEAYRWRSVFNEQIITASLKKWFLIHV